MSSLQASNGYTFLVFFSHDWGKDQLGRDNHDRVVKIFRALADLGIVGWLDEEYMQGDIDKAMCQGIDESVLFVLFITKRYLYKTASDNEQDNCQKEFNYAKQKVGSRRMLCIVMEPQCRDTSTWPGQVAMHLGSKLFFDLAEDKDFDAKMEKLADKLLTMARDAGYKAAHTEPAGVSHPQAKKIEGTKVETGNRLFLQFFLENYFKNHYLYHNRNNMYPPTGFCFWIALIKHKPQLPF